MFEHLFPDLVSGSYQNRHCLRKAFHWILKRSCTFSKIITKIYAVRRTAFSRGKCQHVKLVKPERFWAYSKQILYSTSISVIHLQHFSCFSCEVTVKWLIMIAVTMMLTNRRSPQLQFFFSASMKQSQDLCLCNI